MNRKLPIRWTIAATLAAGWIGVAAAAEPPDPEFTRLDTDRDGTISRAEAARIHGFDYAFREADDNRDGRLDATEFVKAQSVHDRKVAAQYVGDSVITARVKAALVKDPVVSALAVSVETYRGTVVLSGFVDSDAQARRAVEVAAGIEGVVSVKNGIVVKS